MANRKYIVNGVIYEESDERKVIIDGVILEETTVVVAESGRIMGSLAGCGGLAGIGGLAGNCGGLAG